MVEGVDEGDTVLLREPQPDEIVSRLPAPQQQRGGDDHVAEAQTPAGAGMDQATQAAPTNGPSNGPGDNARRGRGGMRPDRPRPTGAENSSK